jgi:hypothetical protein
LGNRVTRHVFRAAVGYSVTDSQMVYGQCPARLRRDCSVSMPVATSSKWKC